jgi:selenocysteine lyase/cysteine desulfurase
MIKAAIGPEYAANRLEELRHRARAGWEHTPGLTVLGQDTAQHPIPIFSFLITDPSGKRIHQQLVTRMLSDLHGVQARGGCACAGPYGHQLLGIDQSLSERFRKSISEGHEIEKPGWTRLGFSVLMSNEKADKIIQAVDAIARDPYPKSAQYCVDETTARFSLEATGTG